MQPAQESRPGGVPAAEHPQARLPLCWLRPAPVLGVFLVEKELGAFKEARHPERAYEIALEIQASISVESHLGSRGRLDLKDQGIPCLLEVERHLHGPVPQKEHLNALPPGKNGIVGNTHWMF